MAKFLNKKEQVIDFKLTSYGHYLLSDGSFDPAYYGFYDDNIIYDGRYVGLYEKQNDIHERIKNNTAYIESLVLFEEVEKATDTLINISDASGPYGFTLRTAGQKYFEVDYIPTFLKPRKDIFRFENMIGDAYLEGNADHAPAWKAVTLEGQISDSSKIDLKNDYLIPQLNIDANYSLKIVDNATREILHNTSFEISEIQTMTFVDNKFIMIDKDDTMLYLEELNTIMLNENYEVEVFEINVDAIMPAYVDGIKTDQLIRKTFQKDYLDLKGENITKDYFDGLSKMPENVTNSRASYYFSIQLDEGVDHDKACKGVELFNKDSYYIDLDFECQQKQIDSVYYDIYGPVTEPEICP